MNNHTTDEASENITTVTGRSILLVSFKIPRRGSHQKVEMPDLNSTFRGKACKTFTFEKKSIFKLTHEGHISTRVGKMIWVEERKERFYLLYWRIELNEAA